LTSANTPDLTTACANGDAGLLRAVAIPVGHGLLPLDGGGNGIPALANSTSNPSPISLTMRPWFRAVTGSTTSARMALSAASVPSSSARIIRL